MLGSAVNLDLQGENFDRKKEKETDRMMKNILRHADSEWREQRCTCAKILDPKNHDKMQRRRAGVVHTNWDNLWTKWSGSQRWWKVSKDWKSFIKTAEELCKRNLINNVYTKKGCPLVQEMVSAQRKVEEAKQHYQNCWIPLKEAELQANPLQESKTFL